ncbi:hypothetical protein QA646_29590 (plasmid) [Rhizobium sp. CB3090]|uniref:hypothetical protein n=1 Tax=Rhizobium sp. CB3090 TaxID=3039156 RepID=UPI0024B059B4|nr:hypothetical protein [Rhizobium sp. CB3090]WFU13361.1 hypothetical protein QA646_29590 [Rhizobium sp. CB3090]
MKVATLVDLTTGLEELDSYAERGELEEAVMLFEDMALQARLWSQLLKAVVLSRMSLAGAAMGTQSSAWKDRNDEERTTNSSVAVTWMFSNSSVQTAVSVEIRAPFWASHVTTSHSKDHPGKAPSRNS